VHDVQVYLATVLVFRFIKCMEDADPDVSINQDARHHQKAKECSEDSDSDSGFSDN
jgi:hypothetical protein